MVIEMDPVSFSLQGLYVINPPADCYLVQLLFKLIILAMLKKTNEYQFATL